MNTFTFDDIYYFDRQSYDSCWYAYTHPAKEPFCHGRFCVDSCRFSSHSETLGEFSTEQIAEIEQLLAHHRAEMDLEQFDVHLRRPAHYELVPRNSPLWERVETKRRRAWPSDPALAVAFEELASENPAYRLTREFVSLIIERSTRVTAEQAFEHLTEIAEDQWTYDTAPYAEEGETYETYFTEFQTSLSKQASGHHFVEPTAAYSIADLPKVYFVVDGPDSSNHFYDRDDLLVPLPIPVRASSHFEYYLT